MPESDQFDCPLCDKANNADDMVECGVCSQWFHYCCVQFDEAKKDDSWQCSVCVCKTASNGDSKTSTEANSSGNDEHAANGSNQISERTRLNLKLIEKQKECLLRGIELEHSQKLEKRKLLLEKEAWRAQYEVLNASYEGVDISSGEVESEERIGEWTRFLNPVSGRTNRNVPVASSTTTVSTTSSETVPQFPTAGSSTNVPTTATIQPHPTAMSAPGAVVSNHPSNFSTTQAYHSQPVPSAVPTSSFVYPTGIVQLDSSTPVTTANWINPISGYTNPTQCLPAIISSSGQFGAYSTQGGSGSQPYQGLPTITSSTGQFGCHLTQGGSVTQPYQVTNSIGNVVSLGQGAYPQYINSSVGLASHAGNLLNTYLPYAPVTFPSSLPQPFSSAPLVHPLNSSVPVINHHVPQAHPASSSVPIVYPNVPQGCLPNQQLPLVNCEPNTPTPRQLAARHVMPRDLPMFSGNPEEWPMFFSAFNTSTEACGYSNVENLGRLQRCLKGVALEAVRSRLLLPASVPQVMQTLQLLYGRPEQIIYALLSKIREVPAPKAENLNTLVSFGMAVQNFCDHLEAAGQLLHLSNPVMLQELVDKLPANLKLDWVTFKRQFQVVDLRVFGKYMSNLVSAAAEVTLTLDPRGARPKREEKLKGFVNAHDTPSAEVDQEIPSPESTKSASLIACLICENPDHRVKECDVFKKMNRDERWKAVHTHYLCRTCLGKHGRKPCRSTVRCEVQGCQMRHHPLLHGSPVNSSSPDSTQHQGGTSQQAHQSEGVNAHHSPSSTLFRILPVKLYNEGKAIETLAFIDEGSSVTLLEKGLAEALEVKGIKKRLCLTWTSNITREEEDSLQVKIEISGIEGNKRYALEDVRTVDSLALPRQTLHYKELACRYEHLKKLPIKDFESAVPGILIGAKNTHLTATQQIREGRVGEPVAAKTRLGWAIYGSVSMGTNYASCNLHICGCDSDDNLHELVKQYFTAENVGVSVDRSPESNDDKRARAILEKTTRRIEGGFETGLLWRYDYIEFPESYVMAVRRLRCLERRFNADPALFENVQHQIVQYQQKGYIHEATEEELAAADPRRLWYLPVGIVRNPKKPSKIRIVWDAAATVDGISLNSMLLKGPDLVQPLPDVLYGFRERQVAVVGDIMEMFHQMKMRVEDRYSQLFVWPGETGSPLKTFVIDVATFGSTSSPCSAQFVKNLNATEHAEEYPRAAEAIVRRHYVDDYLQSFDSEEEACQVIEEVKLVHRRGGFIIRNWLSNSAEVLRRVGEPEAGTMKIVGEGGSKTERVLGMQWKAIEDFFVFSSEIDEETVIPTKRGILRCVMSQFDPLGLLSHFLIHGRVLIQDIWRTKAGWDDPVDKSILERWRLWAAKFKELEAVRIPRAYFPGVTVAEIEDLQLHIFVDGSEIAYACVAYFRALIHGKFQCSLIGGKAKVAPLKTLSIPRLELQAALIGCRLMKTICSSHSLPISRRVIWTDSKTVLSWIHSDHRRYRQFVACRIGEILSKSNPEEWRYVPSKTNVADDATKWCNGPNLKPDSRWFNGPEFLRGSEESWPHQATPELTEAELRPCHVHLAKECEEIVEWDRFSKFERLRRTVAYIHRFADNCRRKVAKQPGQSSHFTHEELNKAEITLWRLVQHTAFPEEMIQLQKMKEGYESRLSRTSRIYKLSPFIDEQGVIRMETRIAGAIFVPYDTKFPIIIPKGHRVTFLLADWYHRLYLHANNETVVNEIRQRFHVPCLRTLVRKLSRSCAQCKVMKAKPSYPREAPLPEARLSPFVRPFSYVGLDYFGPIMVRVGRSLVKRWVALFTCLTIRAVHLEVVHSLSTEACKMAIRRFVVRRGSPLEIRSDNGTNFLGASRELKQQITEINQHLSSIFTNGITKWIFNPPSAPHMGGSWERLVRSIKVAFSSLATSRNPDDETLLTLMTEAEGIVNSRPLTFVPLESDSQEALTPNHFLLLSSQGVTQLSQPIMERHACLRTNWKLTMSLVDQFWHRWVREYLPTISKRTKWFEEAKQPKEGDPVVIVDESVRNGWMRGRILSVVNGRDGRARQALVKTAGGVLRRPVTKVAVLDIQKPSNDGVKK